jgi:hypothetical protein
MDGRCRIAGALLVAALLGGCAEIRRLSTDAASAVGAPVPTVAALPTGADPAPGTAAGAPPPGAATAEEFDTTSPDERAAAAAPSPRPAGGAEGPVPAERPLGTTVASLGDPAAPGFWAETPLVAAVRRGRLTDPASGRSVQVELRPSGGAPGSGTRVSLPAFRVLELPLTALPELTVTGL